MARMPEKVTYRFYGMGISEKRAIKYLTLHNVRVIKSFVEGPSLIVTFAGHKQRHIGALLLKAIGWLCVFFDVKGKWFFSTYETINESSRT